MSQTKVTYLTFHRFGSQFVIWPVKIVPEMTYYVSSGMLSLRTHSLPGIK